MKYMGSKRRFSGELLEVILKERKPDQWWVEPFVGGGNLIDKVEGKRLGADANQYAIQALVSIRDNVYELPKNNSEFTEENYKELVDSDQYKHKGYAGFALSYGGKWLGGWRRDSKGLRDYVAESYRAAQKQSPLLKGVTLINCEYQDLQIPPNSCIYCDPPYCGTTGYRHKFNHEKFWDWCREMERQGHMVFISEYSAPLDFLCIWSKETTSSLTKNTGAKKGTERLFRHVGF